MLDVAGKPRRHVKTPCCVNNARSSDDKPLQMSTTMTTRRQQASWLPGRWELDGNAQRQAEPAVDLEEVYDGSTVLSMAKWRVESTSMPVTMRPCTRARDAETDITGNRVVNPSTDASLVS